jgi:uncharacterized lipoprotein YajG
MKRTVLPLTAAAAILLLSGCATDQMKQDIAEARALAEEAKAAAAAAQSSADTAAAKADAAAAKAELAHGSADAAQACCDANKERVDRMFRKAMMK